MADYSILLYYLFVDVPAPEETAEEQRAWCRELGLKGRIILGKEGINGTVSGLEADASEYMARMATHPIFANIAFKIDRHESHAFKRLSVKVRPEIVTLGVEVDTVKNTGVHLKPKDFRRMLDDPHALVLDIRNAYEFDMGRFRGAARPTADSFKEFPDWIDENFGDARERPILTYCTGGIRCEKLTAYLVEQGYSQVYQLDGGIVSYAKDLEVDGEGFDGDCFVFDDRLSVPVGAPVAECEACGNPSSRYVNCDFVECNRLYFLCEACEQARGLSCSPNCSAQIRKRVANLRLSPSLRSEGARLRQRRHRAKRKLQPGPADARTKLES
jgi:UPF0176 protein